MNKEFCLGVILGLLGGTLIAVNSKKVRKFVCENQAKFTDKLKEHTAEEKEQEEV